MNKAIYLMVRFVAALSIMTVSISGNFHSVFAQGDKVQASIVPGATTTQTDTALSPNPIKAKVGQTVVWTNDDSAFHTVSSGLIGAADAGKIFDSGLAGPTALTAKGKTFEHTFNTIGDFDYHCTLHPVMTGKVIVT